jgi:hypothetical protein
MHSRLITSIAVILTAVLLGRRAFATDHHWNISNGIWSQPADWNPATVPGPTDNAIVDFFSGTPGHVTISTNNLQAVPSVTIANGDSVSVGNNGSLLCGGDFVVGNNSTTGTLSVINSNPINAYFGGLTIAANLLVGQLSGAGTVSQNAGTVAVGNWVVLGNSNDQSSAFSASGMYNLAGGNLHAPAMFVAGNFHTSGTFNLSGGDANFGSLGIGVGSNGVGVLNQTGGQLTVNNSLFMQTGVYTISGGTCNSTGATEVGASSTINFNGGSIFLGTLYLTSTTSRVQLGSGGGKVLRAQYLSLGGGSSVAGTVDLNDNSMTLSGGDPAGRLLSYIRSGYNGGSWTGPGLTSSAAAAAAASAAVHKTALGYGNDGLGNLLVKYTYYGDANLDGQVDVTDLGALATNWQTSSAWSGGDFNYDGFVDVSDLGMLATNWQAGVGSPLATGSFNAALETVGLAAASVPEPAAAMISLLGVCYLRRRRRFSSAHCFSTSGFARRYDSGHGRRAGSSTTV